MDQRLPLAAIFFNSAPMGSMAAANLVHATSRQTPPTQSSGHPADLSRVCGYPSVLMPSALYDASSEAYWLLCVRRHTDALDILW